MQSSVESSTTDRWLLSGRCMGSGSSETKPADHYNCSGVIDQLCRKLEISRDAKPVDVISPQAATSSARRWIAIRCIFIDYFFNCAAAPCVESSMTDHWLRLRLSRVRPTICCVFC